MPTDHNNFLAKVCNGPTKCQINRKVKTPNSLFGTVLYFLANEIVVLM